jgi:hypothetical protein
MGIGPWFTMQMGNVTINNTAIIFPNKLDTIEYIWKYEEINNSDLNIHQKKSFVMYNKATDEAICFFYSIKNDTMHVVGYTSEKNLLIKLNNQIPQQEQTEIILLQTDYLSGNFISGKELIFNEKSDAFTISKEYKSPGDFGSIKLFYSEINALIFYGDIIWAGTGKINFPENWKNAEEFSRTTNSVRPKNGFEIISNSEYEVFYDDLDVQNAWNSLQNLEVVKEYLDSNPEQRVKVYFYQPSVGVGDPADWKWIFFLNK